MVKKLIRIILLSTVALFTVVVQVIAQSTEKDLKFFLNDDGSYYVRGTGLAQIWMRYTDYNPGSTGFWNC